MKNYVIYIMIALTCYMGKAQEPFVCAEEELIDYSHTNASLAPNWSGSIDPAFLGTFEPVVFNVVFWKITDEHGEIGFNWATDIQEEDVLESIAAMNIEYNKFNMFFKYKGFNEIKSPPNLAIREFPNCNTAVEPDPHGYGVIDRCEIGEFYTFAENNGYKDPNAFNIYIPYGTRQFAGASRYNDTKFIIRADIASAGGMVHEMGHNFYLRHTFDNYDNASCERVTRDPNNINFNADKKGDEVVDTAAMPNFAKEYCYANPLDINCIDDPNYMSHVYISDNCTYIGTSVNFYDEFFEINPSDIQNYMAYTVASCRNQFTIGQGIRARETIRDDTQSRFTPAMTTISSLYDPYKGTYYFAGPELPASEKPLFQPGFDYNFIECNGPYPQPAPYNESFSYNPQNIISTYDAYEQNYNILTHPNHSAIRIMQVEQGLGYTNVQKCYDNFNRSPKGGKYTRFNDGVFNTNVTITEMDSLQVNNPQMINNLQPGLYNIEKEYDNGAKQQTVIIKEN